MFLEVGNARFPIKHHQFYKKWYRKIFASQWPRTSPNSMISFKSYVQTPLFINFITLRLGEGHTRTVNRHSGPVGVSYGQLVNDVDSYGLFRPDSGGLTFHHHCH